MANRFDINLFERYSQAFGFLPKNITPKLAGVGINKSIFGGGVEIFTKANLTFDEIVISGAGYVLRFGAYPFLGGKFDFLSDLIPGGNSDEINIFAPPPMIGFSREKNMKITEIDGSDNEIIELYGLKQWDITMQGLLIDMAEHNYPVKQDIIMNRLFEASKIFEVSGLLFINKGIRSIYFRRIDISGVAGFPDTLKYTLNAKSIKPVEYQLLNQIN